MRLRALILSSVLLLISVPAHADPIGTFGWTYDVLFGTGSTFSVTNESSDPFEDVFVDLFRPGDVDPFNSLSLGAVLGGASGQSIDDLSLFLVPDDLSRAIVRLTFSGTTLVTTLLAADLQGDPLDFLAASTVIDSDAPAPIPEPGTLLLLGSGLALLAARRGRAQSIRRALLSNAGGAAGSNL